MATATKSKVLVIGGTGYIGRHLALAGRAFSHPTFVLICPSSFSKHASLLSSFQSAGITLLQGSMDDSESLLAAIKQVDVVISAISFNSLDQLKIIQAIKEAGNIKRFFPSEFGSNVDPARALEPAKTHAYEPKIQAGQACHGEQALVPHDKLAMPESIVLYKLISGLHCSISVHIAADYLLDESTNRWGPNFSLLEERVLKHEDRLNLNETQWMGSPAEGERPKTIANALEEAAQKAKDKLLEAKDARAIQSVEARATRAPSGVMGGPLAHASNLLNNQPDATLGDALKDLKDYLSANKVATQRDAYRVMQAEACNDPLGQVHSQGVAASIQDAVDYNKEKGFRPPDNAQTSPMERGRGAGGDS